MLWIDCLNILGLGILAFRLWPRGLVPREKPTVWPSVSIIVPARNEAMTLPRLLASLSALDYPNYEVIVINDQSTDETENVAGRYPVTVLNGSPKPAEWFGKPWACHQASLTADGQYLLFTDADTVHEPHSLKTAMTEILATQAQGLSAPPFHLNPRIWEKLLGPFFCILLSLTAPFGRPRPKRVFAIGQYLLFERSFYKRIGGHQAIRGEAVDDLALAGLTLAHQGKWHVVNGNHLYGVRMYESLKDFIAGWRRNFRGGLRLSSKFNVVETALYISALTAFRDPRWVSLLTGSMGLIFLAWVQRRYGRFSVWGVICVPISLLVFTTVTALALWDQIAQKPLRWKDRSYLSERTSKAV
jgi:glycosyltransferase involved in cell wall biosynthesis